MMKYVYSYLLFIVLALFTHVSFAGSSSVNDINIKVPNKILVGLVVRHGEIIDAVQPIYTTVNPDGSLGKVVKDQQYGGNGGAASEIYRDGFVVVGLTYTTGLWAGEDRIAGLHVVLQKWENGKTVGDRIIFGPFGDVYKLSTSASYVNILNQGYFINDLEIDVSGQFVSYITPSSGHEKLEEIVAKRVELRNAPFNASDDYYKFNIEIVSGSKSGATVYGIVSFADFYPTHVSTLANRFIFHYGNSCYEMQDLDGYPAGNMNKNALYRSGNPSDPISITFSGGHDGERFGLNAGFSRAQFNRDSEQFIQKNMDYFGYLNSENYVDGAGTVTYEKLDNIDEKTYNNYLCR